MRIYIFFHQFRLHTFNHSIDFSFEKTIKCTLLELLLHLILVHEWSSMVAKLNVCVSTYLTQWMLYQVI